MENSLGKEYFLVKEKNEIVKITKVINEGIFVKIISKDDEIMKLVGNLDNADFVKVTTNFDGIIFVQIVKNLDKEFADALFSFNQMKQGVNTDIFVKDYEVVNVGKEINKKYSEMDENEIAQLFHEDQEDILKIIREMKQSIFEKMIKELDEPNAEIIRMFREMDESELNTKPEEIELTDSVILQIYEESYQDLKDDITIMIGTKMVKITKNEDGFVYIEIVRCLKDLRDEMLKTLCHIYSGDEFTQHEYNFELLKNGITKSSNETISIDYDNLSYCSDNDDDDNVSVDSEGFVTGLYKVYSYEPEIIKWFNQFDVLRMSKIFMNLDGPYMNRQFRLLRTHEQMRFAKDMDEKLFNKFLNEASENIIQFIKSIRRIELGNLHDILIEQYNQNLHSKSNTTEKKYYDVVSFENDIINKNYIHAFYGIVVEPENEDREIEIEYEESTISEKDNETEIYDSDSFHEEVDYSDDIPNENNDSKIFITLDFSKIFADFEDSQNFDIYCGNKNFSESAISEEYQYSESYRYSEMYSEIDECSERAKSCLEEPVNCSEEVESYEQPEYCSEEIESCSEEVEDCSEEEESYEEDDDSDENDNKYSDQDSRFNDLESNDDIIFSNVYYRKYDEEYYSRDLNDLFLSVSEGGINKNNNLCNVEESLENSIQNHIENLSNFQENEKKDKVKVVLELDPDLEYIITVRSKKDKEIVFPNIYIMEGEESCSLDIKKVNDENEKCIHLEMTVQKETEIDNEYDSSRAFSNLDEINADSSSDNTNNEYDDNNNSDQEFPEYFSQLGSCFPT